MPNDSISKTKISRETYDEKADSAVKYSAAPGLTRELVEEISIQKDEPDWMRAKRLKALI